MRFSIYQWALMRPWRSATFALVMGAGLTFAAAPTQAQTTAPRFQEFRIENETVEQARQRVVARLGNSVDIVADASTGRMIVSGSDESLRIVAALIQGQPTAQPTAQPIAPSRPTVSVNTNALGARTTSIYQVPPQSQAEMTRYLESLYRPEAGLTIQGGATAGQMIVVAPTSIQREIAEIMASRGVGSSSTQAPQIDTTPIARRVALRHIDWRQFEATLVQTWGSRLSVQSLMQGQRVRVALPHNGSDQVAQVSMLIDRTTNEITLEGAATLVGAWQSAIDQLDQQVPVRERSRAAWIPVSRPNDPDLRRAISFLRLAAQPGFANPDGLTNSPETQTQSAPRTGQVPARAVSTILQDEGGAPTPALPQGPTDVAPQGEGDGQGAEQPIGPIQLQFIEELGIVVVKGEPQDIERVRRLIQEIEMMATDTMPKTELVTLESIDSQAVATIVQNLYDQVYATRQGGLQITALVKPNAVLLVGREEAITFALELIKQLDTDAPPESVFKVFRLKYMSSEDMKNRINEFYLGISSTGGFGGGGITQGERPGLGTRVRVISDYRSNSLIITASPRDLEEIGQLISELDTVESGAANAVRIFRLKNALAEDLQPVLQDALNGQLQGAGVGANPGGQGLQTNQQLAGGLGQQQLARIRSAMLALNMVGPNGEVIHGGIMYDVRVTADTNSNSLVITGPEENMALIEALVNSLDQLPDVETKIKVFPVINNDAGLLLQLLDDLFSAQNQGGGGNQGGLASVPLQTGADGASTLVGLRFGADPRTNSIIASGSEANLRVIEDLVYRLDQSDLHERVVKVYRLRNTQSASVQTAIQAWLDARATLYGDNTGDSVGVPFSRELIVVSEPDSNSLLVSVAPEYAAEIERIIEEIDRRPMFMIRALIAEVQLGDNEEFGIEAGLQDSIVYDRGIGTIGFPFNQAGLGNVNTGRETLAGQALNNLSFGRTNADLGFGGLVLSAGNESVNLLLRALKQRSRLQVLSSPTIMTLDNITGYVQVGATVRFIGGTTITNGISQNTVEQEDVGIILQVTPRLSPDGMIVMDVDVQKSSLGSEVDGTTVAVDQNGNAIRVPPINRTQAETQIMARHGQTMVFAGLITSTDQQEMRGVPILSDIPAVGRLFRYDAEFQQRSELLIILTPYIVENEGDVAMVNQMTMDRMSWCLSDVASIYGSVGYDDQQMFFESGPNVVYPDLSPTGEPIEGELMLPSDGEYYNQPVPTPAADPNNSQSILNGSRRRDRESAQQEMQFGVPVGFQPMQESGVRPAGYVDGPNPAPLYQGEALPAGFRQVVPSSQLPAGSYPTATPLGAMQPSGYGAMTYPATPRVADRSGANLGAPQPQVGGENPRGIYADPPATTWR